MRNAGIVSAIGARNYSLSRNAQSIYKVNIPEYAQAASINYSLLSEKFLNETKFPNSHTHTAHTTMMCGAQGKRLLLKIMRVSPVALVPHKILSRGQLGVGLMRKRAAHALQQHKH